MQNEQYIKIFIVDDHEIFRNGLKMVISKIKNTKVIAEASNGEYFIEMLDNNIPDIVFMDIEMPVMNGLEASKIALERYPNLKIIVLSMFNDDEYVQNMIDIGVKGFLLKNINREKLEKAINSVYEGNNYYSEELWDFFTRKLSGEEKKNTVDIKFTKREQEILQLLADGLSNKEIADRLFVSERTIVGHKTNLLSKTQCKNTISLLSFAIKNKIIEI